MCPLRFILVLFSTLLAVYFAWRSVRSSDQNDQQLNTSVISQNLSMVTAPPRRQATNTPKCIPTTTTLTKYKLLLSVCRQPASLCRTNHSTCVPLITPDHLCLIRIITKKPSIHACPLSLVVRAVKRCCPSQRYVLIP
ncbi:hypothetical protein RND81_06G128400 [Saponaria officinalis]|uniref:Uncharacterized protein n=1 Tax=Saponaria officinalis TaxID=3572 RepID=A0AAW1KB05_SAPOF